MEKEVSDIYKRASGEISDKWDKYMKSHEGKVASAHSDLLDALASGDKQAIREARAVYERTVRNVTFNDERFKSMVDETTAKLAHTNEVALDYVNGNMAKIYTINYNVFGDEKISGYAFTLVNEQAVKNLAREDKSLLPTKKLDIPKDKKWNTKSINAEILQGILQGENIPKIADRLAHVTDMNAKSAIRNARTMVTSAENKGRQDSFKKAESDGVIMKRMWVAAHDDRTRAWHADLDGVEVDIDEPWQNDYGEIMYPGDPTAHPANVYNCRCSIRSIVKGFKWNQAEEQVEEESRYVDLSEEFHEKQMGEDEYLKWQEENSTQKKIEDDFKSEFGYTPEQARYDKDEWIESEKKWSSEIANEMTHDLIQVQNAQRHCGYIQDADGSKAINAYLRKDEIGMYSKKQMQETIDAMNRLIDKSILNEDIVVDRCAGIDALRHMGIDIGEVGKSYRIGHAFCTDGIDVKRIVDDINNNYVGSIITDKGFMSASVSPDNNVFGGSDVTFTILAPSGTHAFISDNLRESEVVFSPGKNQEILGAKVSNRKAVDYEGKETERKVIEIFLKIAGDF